MKALPNDREHVERLSHSFNLPGVKNGRTMTATFLFPAVIGEPLVGQIKR
jgi:hypothetical protein